MEFNNTEPFPPEYVLTLCTGLQVGNIPFVLDRIYGKQNPRMKALSRDEQERREWGLRMVHEIPHQGDTGHIDSVTAAQKTLFDFGYGRDDVDIHAYWADTPAASLSHDKTRYLLLSRPTDGKAMLLVAGWSDAPIETTFEVDPAVLGFTPTGTMVDAETGEAVELTATHRWRIDLDGLYDNRILIFE